MSEKKGKKQEQSWGADEEALVEFAGSDTDVSALVQDHMDTGDLKALLSSGEFQAEQFIPLREGQRVEGIFLGKGEPILMNNPQARADEEQKRAVPTWRIQHPTANVIMVLASGAGLDSKIGGIPVGEYIIIQKNGQRQLGSRRVNDFVVLHSAKRGRDFASRASTKAAAQPTA